MWYRDIVIFWNKNHEPISQYHTGCDIVIFNQNVFSRISQYHEGCDIVIFNKNGSDRISQYHMECDIVISPHRGLTLYIFEEKYSLKNTLLNVLPYEQAS